MTTEEGCKRSLLCSKPNRHVGHCDDALAGGCTCEEPDPVLLTIWGTYQCNRCFRVVFLGYGE